MWFAVRQRLPPELAAIGSKDDADFLVFEDSHRIGVKCLIDHQDVGAADGIDPPKTVRSIAELIAVGPKEVPPYVFAKLEGEHIECAICGRW